ncbi:hypothetical protein ABN028_33990 [Actinopolymorpha sp. B17G11]|uniref:hypothetical protein n=1 Tax=Actinopolymorpha sp. B17G11 TaxID=3160861 RepID=UPI0032E3C048
MTALFLAVADDGRGTTVLVVLAVGAGAGYLASLKLHPYTNCRRCGGGAKHHGDLFGYAFRACRRCGGTGRKLRLGVRLLHPNNRPPTGRR